MKRSKKIWIVCAALAVVVVLCAFALLYRPVPYRFLEGSRYVKTEYARQADIDFAVRSYRVRGTVDSVAKRAQLELTPQDGWRLPRRYPDGSVQFGNGDIGVNITTKEIYVEPEFEPMAEVPGTVYVTIDEEATFIDRVLVWIHNR